MATNARVTLQHVEALYTVASETTNTRVTKAQSEVVWAPVALTTNARITKAFIEFVWLPSSGVEHNESASNEISLSDDGSCAMVFQGSCDTTPQDPSITDSMVYDWTFLRSLAHDSSDLALGDEATVVKWLPQVVPDPLTLLDAVARDTVLALPCSDSLSLDDVLGADWVFVPAVSDSLTLIDGVVAVCDRRLIDPLSLVDEATVTWIDFEEVSDTVTFTPSSAAFKVASRPHEDTVEIADLVTVQLVYGRQPADTLTVTDVASALYVPAEPGEGKPRPVRLSMENVRPVRMRL